MSSIKGFDNAQSSWELFFVSLKQDNEPNFRVEVSIQLGGKLWKNRETPLPGNSARLSGMLILIMEKNTTSEIIHTD